MRRWGTAVSVMWVCATRRRLRRAICVAVERPEPRHRRNESRSEIEVVQVTDAVAADVARRIRRQLFSDVLGSGDDSGTPLAEAMCWKSRFGKPRLPFCSEVAVSMSVRPPPRQGRRLFRNRWSR